ncbi:histidinol dehydrogenase, partial [Candidatus Hydrogenedentota bacterium]
MALEVIDMRGLEISAEDAAHMVARGKVTDESAETLRTVAIDTAAIIRDVRERGDAAVLEYTKKFDKTRLKPAALEVSSTEIHDAYQEVPKDVVRSLRKAQRNIEAFHASRVKRSWTQKYPDGSKIGQKVTPIDRIGAYTPGGKAYYPSTVLMNVVPAVV